MPSSLSVAETGSSLDVPFITAAAMEDAGSVADAVDALERTLLDGFDPENDLMRTDAPVTSGHLLLMPTQSSRAVGVKLVSIAPDNPAAGKPLVQALYTLFDATTLTPIATLDGTHLTTCRTAAVSALAARRLARADARRLAVFGAGVQAWAHVQSLSAILPIAYVDVIGRDPGRAQALVEQITTRLGIEAGLGSEASVGAADVVACTTTARTPLFRGELLRPGTAVLAVGAFEPSTRELDDETMRRGVVVVESVTSALREAGEVVMSIASGALAVEDLVSLRTVVCDAPRLPEDAVRVFKSTGMSWQDLAVATMLYERLYERTQTGT